MIHGSWIAKCQLGHDKLQALENSKRPQKVGAKTKISLILYLTMASESKPKKSASRLPKTLNLNTYKDHSVGDYVDSIRRYGTVDSYSTESVRY